MKRDYKSLNFHTSETDIRALFRPISESLEDIKISADNIFSDIDIPEMNLKTVKAKFLSYFKNLDSVCYFWINIAKKEGMNLEVRKQILELVGKVSKLVGSDVEAFAWFVMFTEHMNKTEDIPVRIIATDWKYLRRKFRELLKRFDEMAVSLRPVTSYEDVKDYPEVNNMMILKKLAGFPWNC